MGVVVVAAAGNYSTSRRFYPAAFAQRPASPGQVPLISVGALNPNGSKAIFSDDGHWVTAWAAGGAVVSTLPNRRQRQPHSQSSECQRIRLTRCPRASRCLATARRSIPTTTRPDSESGAARRSRPRCWARIIVRSLLKGPADPGSGLVLKPCGTEETTNRALAALNAMGWPG